MFWKKYKEVIAIFIFLCLMGVVYYFVISRLVVEIKNNKNKLQEAGITREIQQKRLGELPKIKKDFERLKESEKKIAPFLDKDRAVELIQEVEKFAAETENEVAIEVVAQEAPAKGKAKDSSETIVGSLPSKDYLQFRIKITGTFFSLLKLLNKLENSHYYSDIVSLQISRDQNSNKENKTDPVSKNPFNQSVSGEVRFQDNEEKVVSLISIVVYTKN